MNKNDMKFKFIDLFCGVGGFHQGMNALGGKCVFAIDIDKNCREVYKKNWGMDPWINEEIKGNIKWFTEKEHRMEKIPDHDVLCAGFPCQSFSKAGKRGGLDQTEGTLFYDLAKIIQYKKPKYIFLENVPNLISHDGGETWKVIAKTLKDLEYSFPDPPVVFSPHLLNTPQIRERVFVLGRRLDKKIIEIKRPKKFKCEIKTVLETGKNKKYFKPYKISDTKKEVVNMWNDFIKINFAFEDFKKKYPRTKTVHCLPGFPIWVDEFNSDKNLKDLPRWKRIFIEKNRTFYQENKKGIDKWLKKWKPVEKYPHSLYKFEWQAQDSERDLSKLILQFRPSGLRVKKGTYFPALVAITQTSIVGSEMRRLTPRETARLQDFPDSFKIDEKDSAAYKQFGNAVNCKVVEHLGSLLLK